MESCINEIFWREALGKAAEVIVPMSMPNDDNRLPFYCVHSLSGAVTELCDLARLLGPQQPFFGIQVPTNMRIANFAGSIESIAAHYANALTEFQPTGRLALGGWSAGGIIALEMAQQLRERGRNVSLLVVIDTELLNTGAEIGRWNLLYYWEIARNFPRYFRDDLIKDLSFQSFAKRISLIIAKALAPSAEKRINRDVTVHNIMNDPYFSSVQKGFMRALLDALYEYAPKPYPGDTLVYTATTQPLGLRQVNRQWLKIALQSTIVPVRGVHTGLVKKPEVFALAEDLQYRLHQLASSPMPGL